MATEATLVETHDTLVPDPQVQKEFGVSAMSIWRWDRDPELIKHRGRHFVSPHKAQLRS